MAAKTVHLSDFEKAAPGLVHFLREGARAFAADFLNRRVLFGSVQDVNGRVILSRAKTNSLLQESETATEELSADFVRGLTKEVIEKFGPVIQFFLAMRVATVRFASLVERIQKADENTTVADLKHVVEETIQGWEKENNISGG